MTKLLRQSFQRSTNWPRTIMSCDICLEYATLVKVEYLSADVECDFSFSRCNGIFHPAIPGTWLDILFPACMRVRDHAAECENIQPVRWKTAFDETADKKRKKKIRPSVFLSIHGISVYAPCCLFFTFRTQQNRRLPYNKKASQKKINCHIFSKSQKLFHIRYRSLFLRSL